ncbi:MAG: acyl-CoA-like ligand-binding transcription factor [Thermoleophilaceae bacterium]
MEASLRERKKQKTRRVLSEIALRRFVEKGVDATTVEEICEEAEVSVSTFFRYFPSKEAAVFADENERVDVVREVIESAPADEPLPDVIRRAALTLIDYDLEHKLELHRYMELIATEPALAAYSLQAQNSSMAIFTDLVAKRLGLDAQNDLLPRLVVAGAYAAVNTAWWAWIGSDGEGDLPALINQAFDVFEAGIAASL